MKAGGFAERLKNFFGIRKSVSEELFEDLTDLLVEGDFGAAEAMKTADKLRAYCKKEGIGDPEKVRAALAELLEAGLREGGKALSPGGTAPGRTPGASPLTVVLLLGVNGVGKTTSAAKLARYFRDLQGRKPILAAADTFRAAAIDQLKIHGERLGLRVVAHQHGGDSAAVVYDAIEAALAGGGDLVLADTAGRMHTRAALVEELKKIDRVVETKALGGGKGPGGEYLKYLVLDATTGRNALAQAETFHQAVSLDGVILTKYDSGAKGGVVFSLMAELGLPVVYLCEGEKYEDIRPFDPSGFVREFTGLD
ncbi:MAG: signal recognition particle-docking protein FtsY [Treponema sp.]|jgi:fused signal recognition particle receptor|nr:signal recognition particle-docking protein FtsY [Treponema sp.]